jgi:hypothetical protein
LSPAQAAALISAGVIHIPTASGPQVTAQAVSE